MAQGIVAAHQEVLLARSDITGQLGIINITVQHIRETLDEVRDVQHKHPSSLNGNGTSQ